MLWVNFNPVQYILKEDRTKREIMIIHVGTKNVPKLTAVQQVVELCPDLFPHPQVIGVEVGQGLYDHPKDLDQTVSGAMGRAQRAFGDCEYSIGLEGGLMDVPYTLSGKMEVAVCAIYDGKAFYIGVGPAFEWPPAVTRMILEDQADASTAFRQLGYTSEEKLGARPGGAIGFLTSGLMTRERQTTYSIISALVRLKNKEMYQPE